MKKKQRGTLRHVKHVFLATRENGGHPHALRTYAVATALLVALVIEAGSLIQVSGLKHGGFTATVLPSVVASLTNDERTQDGDQPLTVDSLLSQAAQMKADDMAAKGYFAHTAPDGTEPWYWFGKVGYDYQYAGENLAIDFDDSKELVDAWMNSKAHRENILKPQYTKIGIGIAHGIYQGEETTFVVQFFAKPRAQTTAAAPVKTVQPQHVVSVAPSGTHVLGESTVVATVDPNLWQRIQASPRTYANDGLIALAVFFAFSLVLAFIPIRALPHPNAVQNGVAFLIVILILITLNRSVLASGLSLPSSDMNAAVAAAL